MVFVRLELKFSYHGNYEEIKLLKFYLTNQS